MQRATLTVFFAGIVGLTSYETFIRERLINDVEQPSHVMVFDTEEILGSSEVEKLNIDHFFTKDIFPEKKIELDTENVFGFDFQS